MIILYKSKISIIINNMVRFGDSDAFIINDLELKNKIIDYIFNTIEPSNYKFNMLENIQQLNYLKGNEHYVSPNFKGYNYFLLFTKFTYKNILSSYCVAIDKKMLSYQKKTIDVKKVFMYKIKVMASSSIFKGTLLDCKMIKNMMLIKDCYQLMGNSIIDMDMIEKMIHLDNIIANQFHVDYCENFKLKINKFYNYEMLADIINNIIPKCELEIIGLVFSPKKSGICYIFNEKKQQEKVQIENTNVIKNESYNMIHQIKDFLNNREYSYETNGKKKVLYVEPSEISDVFTIYDNDERIGIAHIPNFKISTYCRENILEKTKCLCIFNKQFNKWIPLKIQE